MMITTLCASSKFYSQVVYRGGVAVANAARLDRGSLLACADSNLVDVRVARQEDPQSLDYQHGQDGRLEHPPGEPHFDIELVLL